MDNTGKIKLVRQGWPDKYVTKSELDRVNYLEHGWKVSEQQDSLKMQELAKALKSSMFSANPAGLKKLREALEGKTQEEILDVFEGEEKPKMIELRDKLLADLQPEKKEDPESEDAEGEPLSSDNFEDTEEGMEKLKSAVAGMDNEAIALVFQNESRESFIHLYTELTK